MTDNHALKKSDLIYRPSRRYPDHGIYYKYEIAQCLKHGLTEHIKVDQNTICRACAKEREEAKKRTQKGNMIVSGVNSHFIGNGR